MVEAKNFIVGRINDGYDYEFMVVIPQADGNYLWVADFEEYYEAENFIKEAEELNANKCFVVHDVRIAHKRKRHDFSN